MATIPNPPAQHLLQLAAQAMAANRFDEAEAHLRAALAHDPHNPTALHHLALRLWLRGQTADARTLLDRAVASAPNDTAILTSFATMLHELHQPREALDAFLRILALDNTQPEIWNAAGICLRETNQPAQAIEFYLRSLTLRPTFAEAHSNLGAILADEGDPTAAIDHLTQAIALNPTLPDAHHNLGIAHRALLQYPAAATALREAHRLAPENPETLAALGELLSLIDDPDAEAILRRAVTLRPHDPEKHWNLSLELLKRGDYTHGWPEYEHRWQRPKNQQPLRTFPQPLWRGQPLADRTLLLHAEQGFGDTIQFLRYIPTLINRGARLILEVQPALLALTQTFAAQYPNQIHVVATGDPIPAFDLHLPLLSLPAILGTTLQTIPPPLRLTPPTPTENLSSRPESAHFADAVERPAVPANSPLRIGIAWAGNPNHSRDRERSIPTQSLLPLLQTPNISWVSLQAGPAAAQHDTLPVPIDRPPLTDFLTTAQLIDTLDLVLSVDSVVAHLAASQGIPTWLLLPYVTEWRWLRPQPGPSTGTPWYPNLQVFRQRTLPNGQPQPELWAPLLTEVATALQTLISSNEQQALP